VGETTIITSVDRSICRSADRLIATIATHRSIGRFTIRRSTDSPCDQPISR
jgi:hypothetical protein